jgi:hypothetical protein
MIKNKGLLLHMHEEENEEEIEQGKTVTFSP